MRPVQNKQTVRSLEAFSFSIDSGCFYNVQTTHNQRDGPRIIAVAGKIEKLIS